MPSRTDPAYRPPVAAKHGPNRQRLELVDLTGDLGAEVDRLVSLGARVRERAGEAAVERADPDGDEFSLAAAEAGS